MLVSESTLRVRYGETDRMGYAHHANYLLYFEIGRTDMLREMGFTYRDMEEKGTLLPVREITIEYLAPALYDEMLTIRTCVKEMPTVSMKFLYEVFNSSGQLISRGTSTLVFTDARTRKPTRPPAYFIESIKDRFK